MAWFGWLRNAERQDAIATMLMKLTRLNGQELTVDFIMRLLGPLMAAWQHG